MVAVEPAESATKFNPFCHGGFAMCFAAGMPLEMALCFEKRRESEIKREKGGGVGKKAHEGRP